MSLLDRLFGSSGSRAEAEREKEAQAAAATQSVSSLASPAAGSAGFSQTQPELPPAISFSQSRLDSFDPTQLPSDAERGTSAAEHRSVSAASAASLTTPRTPAAPAAPVSIAQSSMPSGSPVIGPYAASSVSPSPSPVYSASVPPFTHRQSSSLTLAFSLLPPTSGLSFHSSAAASLGGEEDVPFASAELETLWLQYEEESSNILQQTKLEAFARALLPTITCKGEGAGGKAGCPLAPSLSLAHCSTFYAHGGHPVRLLQRLKSDFVSAWPTVRKEISDAILGKKSFAAVTNFSLEQQPKQQPAGSGAGGAAAQRLPSSYSPPVSASDPVSICCSLGPSFLSLYLLYRLFLFSHNRRVLLRMDWLPWLVKVCQLIASQYQAGHQHADGSVRAAAAAQTEDSDAGEPEMGEEEDSGEGGSAEEDEAETGGQEGEEAADTEAERSKAVVRDGPVEEEEGELAAEESKLGLSVDAISAEAEQQRKEAEWQQRRQELAERKRNSRRLLLYLECSLIVCLSMCSLVADADDDWRRKSSRRGAAAVVSTAASASQSAAPSALSSPVSTAAASSASSVPAFPSGPAVTPSRSSSTSDYREGHGNRTTLLDDSGMVEVLSALLRVLSSLPAAVVSYSQLSLARAALHVVGAMASDNKRVQWLVIQQAALDSVCAMLRWEKGNDREGAAVEAAAAAAGGTGAGGGAAAVAASSLQSPSSFHHINERITLDSLFGLQEREEEGAASSSPAGSASASVSSSANTSPRSLSLSLQHRSRSRSSSLPQLLPQLSISLFHVHLLGLQLLREVTSQQLPACLELVDSVALPSMLRCICWICCTFRPALPPQAALEAVDAVQVINRQLTQQATALLSSLSAQQQEAEAEDGQSLFSLPEFRMAPLSSSPVYSSRIDPQSLQPLRSRSPCLDQLFSVLLSFLTCADLVVTASSSFFAMFSSSSSRSSAAAMEPTAYISYRVAALLFSIIDEQRHRGDDGVLRLRQIMRQTRLQTSSAMSPSASRSPSPAASPCTSSSSSALLLPSVQLLYLSMLREAVTVKPSLIPFIRSSGFYSVFFQSCFYFFSEAESSPAASPLLTARPSVSLSFVSDLQRLLRVSVTDLLIHCMLSDGSGEVEAQAEEMRYLLSCHAFAFSLEEAQREDGRHALDISRALIDLFTVRRHHAAAVLVAAMEQAAASTPSTPAFPPSPAHLSLPFSGINRSAFTLDTPLPQVWTMLLARQHALVRSGQAPMLLPAVLWTGLLLLLEHVIFSSLTIRIRLLRDESFCLQLCELMLETDHVQRRLATRCIIALMTAVDDAAAVEARSPASPLSSRPPLSAASTAGHRRSRSSALPPPAPLPQSSSSSSVSSSRPPTSVPTTPVLSGAEEGRAQDGLQLNKRLLFTRYLEMLPLPLSSSLSTPSSSASLSSSLLVTEELLAGLRRLLSVHTRSHQDILRRRHALPAVINLLLLVLSRLRSRRQEEEHLTAGGTGSTAAATVATSAPVLSRGSSSTIDGAVSMQRERSVFSPSPTSGSPIVREGGGSEGSSIVPSMLPSPTLSSVPSLKAAAAFPPPLHPSFFPSAVAVTFSPSATEQPSRASACSSPEAFAVLSSEESSRLCVSVLLTLTSLLSGNRRSLDLFRRFIGYELLTDVLVMMEDCKPSRQVTQALLHMLVDGHFQLANVDIRREKTQDAAEAAAVAAADGSSASAQSETPASLMSPTSDLLPVTASSLASPAAAVVSGPAPPSLQALDASAQAATPAASFSPSAFSFSPYVSSSSAVGDGQPMQASVPPLSSRLSRAFNSMPSLPDRFLISNPDVLSVLFSRQRFLRCSLALQLDLLQMAHSLVSLSSLNAAFAAKVSLVDLVLDLFPHFPPLLAAQTERASMAVQAIALIKQCGLYSLTVKQLKRIIGLMRSRTVDVQTERLSAYSVQLQSSAAAAASLRSSAPAGPLPPSPTSSSAPPPLRSSVDVSVQVRPFYTVSVLEAVEEMSAKDGPDNYLWLDGLQGGLSLPPLQVFPSRGWSISTWLRIESFSPPSASASHVQRYSYSARQVAPVSLIPAAVLSRLSPIARLAALSASRSSAGVLWGSPSPSPGSSASATPRPRPSSHHPRLLQLLTAAHNGAGLDVFFTDRRLTVSVLAGRGHVQTAVIENSQLRERQWYHLAIAQSPPPTFGASELRVYIDGQCVHSSSTLRYPAVSRPLRHCFIGSDGVQQQGAEDGSEGRVGKASQCLYGQLGPFYLLDDALTAAQARTMHALGPGFLFTFAGDQLMEAEREAEAKMAAEAETGRAAADAAASSSQTGRDDATAFFSPSQRKRSSVIAQSLQSLSVARDISSRILLAYNAKARDGRLHLNIAPRVQEEAERALNLQQSALEKAGSGLLMSALSSTTAADSASAPSRGMNATAMDGTYQCVTRHVLDVLSCLNGIASLFPLFSQLDQPVQRCTEVSDAEKERRRRRREEQAREEEQQRVEEEERRRREQEAAKERSRQAALEAKLRAVEALQEAEYEAAASHSSQRRDNGQQHEEESQTSGSGSAATDDDEDDDELEEGIGEDEEEEESGEGEEEESENGEEGNGDDAGDEANGGQRSHAAAPAVQDAEDDKLEDERDDVVAELVSSTHAAHFVSAPPHLSLPSPTSASAAHQRVPSDGADILNTSWTAAERGLDVSNSDEAIGIDLAADTQSARERLVSFTPSSSSSMSSFSGPAASPSLSSFAQPGRSSPSLQAGRAAASAPSSLSLLAASLPALPPVAVPDLSLLYDFELQYELDSRLLPHVLRCLLCVFSDHPLQQRFMLMYRGFHLLAAQLEQSSPRHLSLKALLQIDRLLQASRPYPRLYRSSFFSMLCNLRLWLYVTPAVQRSWLRLLCQVVMKAPWLVRHASGSQRILDQLRAVCWFESEADSQALRHELLHPVTHATIGIRPFMQNLHVLRQEILNILNIAVSAHGNAPITAPVQLLSSLAPVLPSFLPAVDEDDDDELTAAAASTTVAALAPPDVRAVVLCLQSLGDEEQKVELLQLLYSWMQGDDGVMVCKALAELDFPMVTVPADWRIRLQPETPQRNGLDIFLASLHSSLSAVRVLSLRCLHKMMRAGVKLAEKELFVAVLHILRAEEERRQERDWREDEREREERRHDSVQDADRVQQQRRNASHGVLDEPLYLALLSLMLGVVVDEDGLQSMRHSLWMEDAVIMHVTVLQIIFALIAMQTSVRRNRQSSGSRRPRTVSAGAEMEMAENGEAEAEAVSGLLGTSLSHPESLSSDDLLVLIMQDIQFLLLHSDSNRTLVLEQWAWPSWLFAVMVEPRRRRDSSAAASKRPASAYTVTAAAPASLLAQRGSSPLDSRPASSPAATLDAEPAGPRLSPSSSTSTVLIIQHDDVVASSLTSTISSSSPLSPSPSHSGSSVLQSTFSHSVSFVTSASGTLFSYALSMLEHCLFFALHRQQGWRTYERCLSWLALYQYEPAPSPLPHFPAASTPCHHSLPVLQILRSVLLSLHQLLRKEAEVRQRETEELAALMDNMQQLTRCTEAFLLQRVQAYARLLAASGAASPTVSPAARSSTPAASPVRQPIPASSSLTNLAEAPNARKASRTAAAGGQGRAGPASSSSPPPPVDGWEQEEVVQLVEAEMSAVWPMVELLLGVQAWLFLMRQQVADEQASAAAAAAQLAETELANASKTRWLRFGSGGKSGSSTPVKAFNRHIAAPSLASAAINLQQQEQQSLVSLLLRLLQVTSASSSCLHAMLFACSRTDQLTGIMAETYFGLPAEAADISVVLARYSTPDRVRGAEGGGSSSAYSHRRAASAFAFSSPAAAATSGSSSPASVSLPNSLGDRDDGVNDLRSSLCTLLCTLATNLQLWALTDGARIASSAAALPSSQQQQQDGQTGGLERMQPMRSQSSPGTFRPPPHPLHDLCGGSSGGSVLSVSSAFALIACLLRVMQRHCPAATFLIPCSAVPAEQSSLRTPSPQPPSSGLSSSHSTSYASPPASPQPQSNRASPGQPQSALLRPWRKASHGGQSGGEDDRERARERSRMKMKEIGLRFGLDFATNAALSSSPSHAALAPTASSQSSLFSSQFSALPGRSPGRPAAPLQPSAAALRKSSLRVLTDSSAQLAFVSVSFTLPPEVDALLQQAGQLSDPETAAAGWAACSSLFLHSGVWQQIVELLKPAASYFLRCEADEVRRMVESLNRASSLLLDMHGSVQAAEAQHYFLTQLHVDALQRQHQLTEYSRRQAVKRKAERKRRGEQQSWKLIMRSLTTERGAWRLSRPQPDYWKLDETENSSRMRIKTKRNYAGSSHSEAANDEASAGRRAEGSSRDSKAVTLDADPSLPSSADELHRMALLFSRAQRGVIAPEAVAGGETQAAAAEEEEFDTLSEAQEAQEAAEKEDEQQQQQPDLSTYSTQSWIVHPADRFPGLLTLTAFQLQFEAREEEPDARRRHRRRASRSDEHETRKKGRDYAWPLSTVTAIYYRRHQLQRNSLEIFLSSQVSVFLKFSNELERDELRRRLAKGIRKERRHSPQLEALMASYSRPHVFPHLPFLYSSQKPTFGGPWGGSPAEVLRSSGLTLAWQRRQISNFEYLMQLNSVAGRTFNDLAQYPVFPWILADYSSSSIDLHDESRYDSTYRDLSKPIGALNPVRLRSFLDRYAGLERDKDPSLPPFLYGSSYSSSGAVLYYLLRLEPFTSAAIQLQDGHFDHADRLFSSVASTWQGVNTGAADVKELIPEWFYQPLMFRNENRLPLGRNQAGQLIDDVELPPWAAGSPEQFVRIHREALESEYVSAHLHHWLDLIFGYKQRGKEAEAAHNVFFHLTYEGAVDLQQIEPELRAATVAQIEHFGQCPMQLLTSPHPARFSLAQLESTERMLSILPLPHQRQKQLQLYSAERMTAKASVDNPLLFVYVGYTTDRLLLLGLDRILSVHKWKNSSPTFLPPYTLELDRKRRRRRLGVHFAVGLNILPFFFAVSRCERFVLSVGHWDNSLRVTELSSGCLHQSVVGHKDIVTCVAQTETGDFIVTGSKDATVLVWANHQFARGEEERAAGGAAGAGASGLAAGSAAGGGGGGGSSRRSAHLDLLVCDRPRHVLYGHDDEVSCVAVSGQYDVVCSGSRDGTIIIHTLRTGRYTRTIAPAASAPSVSPLLLSASPSASSSSSSSPSAIRFLSVTQQGVIVAYAWQSSTLLTFSLNGRLLHSAQLSGDRLYASLVSTNGQWLLVGGDAGSVGVWRLSDLQCVQQLAGGGQQPDATIRCLCLTPNEQHLLAGTAKGELLIYALDQQSMTTTLIKRLQQIGL